MEFPILMCVDKKPGDFQRCQFHKMATPGGHIGFLLLWIINYIWIIFIPLAQRSCWGVSSLLCSAYSFFWIHFIFIHLIKQLPKACRVWTFLQNLKICIFGNFFFKLLWLCLVFTWVLMWITSMGIHGAAGGISERRRSSCSSFILYNFLRYVKKINCLWYILLITIIINKIKIMEV